jgi:hypothetical protein
MCPLTGDGRLAERCVHGVVRVEQGCDLDPRLV